MANSFMIHYPCGVSVSTIKKTNMYMHDRYSIMEVLDESGATMYNVIDGDDLEIIESFDDKSEAEEAIKFWNQ